MGTFYIGLCQSKYSRLTYVGVSMLNFDQAISQVPEAIAMKVAMATSIVLSFVLVFTLFVQVKPYFETSEAVVHNRLSQVKFKTPARRASSVNQLHLFGQYKGSARMTIAPENIKLLGIFMSISTKKSSAVMVEEKSEEESYRIGDKLPGGAIIKKIQSDRVIILLNGDYLHVLLNTD